MKIKSHKSKLVIFVLFFLFTSCFKTAQQMKSPENEKEDSKPEYLKANLNADLDHQRTLIQKMNGNLQEQSVLIKSLQDENEKLKNRLAQIEQELGKSKDEYTKNMANLTADVALLDERTRNTETRKPITLKNESAYDTAKELINKKDYKSAVQILDKALTSKTRFRDQLLYLQGEAYFELKEYRKALISFNDLVEIHKSSKKWSQAVNKGALAFERLGMKEEAKAYRGLLKEAPPPKEKKK